MSPSGNGLRTHSAVSAYGAVQGPPLIGLTRQSRPTGLYRAHPLLDSLGGLGLRGCTGPTPYWTHSAVSAYGAEQSPPLIGLARRSRPMGLNRAHPLLDPLGSIGLRGCTGPTPYWTRSAVSAYGAIQGPPLIGPTRQSRPTGLNRAHPLLDPLGSIGLRG